MFFQGKYDTLNVQVKTDFSIFLQLEIEDMRGDDGNWIGPEPAFMLAAHV